MAATSPPRHDGGPPGLPVLLGPPPAQCPAPVLRPGHSRARRLGDRHRTGPRHRHRRRPRRQGLPRRLARAAPGDLVRRGPPRRHRRHPLRRGHRQPRRGVDSRLAGSRAHRELGGTHQLGLDCAIEAAAALVIIWRFTGRALSPAPPTRMGVLSFLRPGKPGAMTCKSPSSTTCTLHQSSHGEAVERRPPRHLRDQPRRRRRAGPPPRSSHLRRRDPRMTRRGGERSPVRQPEAAARSRHCCTGPQPSPPSCRAFSERLANW